MLCSPAAVRCKRDGVCPEVCDLLGSLGAPRARLPAYTSPAPQRGELLSTYPACFSIQHIEIRICRVVEKIGTFGGVSQPLSYAVAFW